MSVGHEDQAFDAKKRKKVSTAGYYYVSCTVRPR